MAFDPYAAIRTIPGAYFAKSATPATQQYLYNSMGDGGQFFDVPAGPELWSNSPEADWDALLKPGGFQSKYNAINHVDDNTVRVRMQQPGAHKYDTMDAVYRLDPTSGNWALQNDPMQAKTREVSTGESFYRDPFEQFGKDFVLPAAAMYFGAQGIEGLLGQAGAASGSGAAASTSAGGAATGAGAMTAEQVAMLAANGLTDAQIAAMATAAGDTAMAASLTGAGMGGGGLLAAGADAAANYAPAMNAAQAESAVGTAGYGASSAGPGGGAGQLSGGLLSGLGDFGTAAQKAIEYAAKNPKIVGGLLGAAAGATEGGGGGGAEPYTGPMPTISRGGWQPRAQTQMMQLPTFGQGLNTSQGNANSGLWRFMGGK